MQSNHGARAHSKFSASGAERWFCCPGSVSLSEGLPDKETIYSKEGTEAHEVLERLLKIEAGESAGRRFEAQEYFLGKPKEMLYHAERAANFILNLHEF